MYKERIPGIDSQNLRGTGNRLRHGYNLTDDEKVWRVIQQDLPSLKISAGSALVSFQTSDSKKSPK